MRVQVTYALDESLAKVLVPLVQVILAPGWAETTRQETSKYSDYWFQKENGHYFARSWSKVNNKELLYEVAILDTSIEIGLRNPFSDVEKQVVTKFVLTLEKDCVFVTEHLSGLGADYTFDIVSIIIVLGSLSEHAQKEETT